MIYAILLDDYQDEVRDDQYAVSFSGSLAECKARTNHGGRYDVWLKSDFLEASSIPTKLEGPTAAVNNGRIVGLQAARTAKLMDFVLPAALAATAVIGVAVFAGTKAASKKRSQRP